MFWRRIKVSQRAGVTQLVECDLAKVDVAGSNPVSRSIIWPAMTKPLAGILLFSSLLVPVHAQDYKLAASPMSGPPAGLPAAYTAVLGPGMRIDGPDGADKVEIWFCKTITAGPAPSDPAIVFGIAQGTLLGVIRWPGKGEDRRGQTISPGLYTLRYSDFPVDGAHQGVAPQRDFALMTPIGNDPDPAAKPAFDALVQASTKASNSPHPAVLSLEPSSATAFPSLSKEGDTPDWVLNVQVGTLKLGIILIGKFQG